MVTLDEAVTLLESGVPIKVILVLDSSAGGDAVIGRPNVERFEDLAGRSVGFEFSAVNAYVLCKASQIHALDCRRDFRKVDVPLNDQVQAFLSGTVDAVVTFEPFKSRLIRSGGNLLFDTKEIPEDVVDVLVFHETAIQTNRNKIQAVVNAWFLAIDHIKANPEGSNQIMRQRAQLTAGEFEEAMAGIILGDRELNHRMMVGGDPTIYHNLSNIIRFMKDHDLIFTAPKIDGVIEPAFIGNVRQ
jgi:NitT/TauT family transport system substrate-binding protein